MTETAVVAFSGGLDTSFLVPFAKEKYGFSSIVTCTVNTGGFDADEQAKIEKRSKEVGADKHIFINAEEEFYESVLKYLIFGNVSRDGYPLSVGSERLIQAQKVVDVAQKLGCSTVLHGSTGAGNDQYRFDVAIQVYSKGKIRSIAPIREFSIARETSTQFLNSKGIAVPAKNTMYSYNAGLWGVSIGGAETHNSMGLIPESAWYSTGDASRKDETLKVTYEKGILKELSCSVGSAKTPVEIIKLLTKIGNAFSIGRHYHVGTSVPGKKGRLAYESPAADIIYETHRTLEKITLTQAQISGKKALSEEYGKLIHEAKFFDPFKSDLEAFFASTQRRVTGVTEATLTHGYIKSAVADSPYNLLAIKGATYGETSDAYSGRDAEGASKLHGFEQLLYRTLDD